MAEDDLLYRYIRDYDISVHEGWLVRTRPVIHIGRSIFLDGRFRSDEEAQQFVAKRAEAGDKLAMRAIRSVLTQKVLP